MTPTRMTVIHMALLAWLRLLGGSFFRARALVYLPVYYLGIVYLRSVVWLVGVIGIGMMLAAI